jgi:hypothetical protein
MWPASDHLGPVGQKCQEQPPVSVDDGSHHGRTSEPDSTGRDTALHELADQMGKLTLGLQKMQDDLQEVKSEVRLTGQKVH